MHIPKIKLSFYVVRARPRQKSVALAATVMAAFPRSNHVEPFPGPRGPFHRYRLRRR